MIRGKLPHSSEMRDQSVPIDCLDDELVKGSHYDEMVANGQDLREVALERCVNLQQVARGLGCGQQAMVGVSPFAHVARDV